MTILFLTLIVVMVIRVIYLYSVDRMSEEGITICAVIMFIGGIILYHLSLIGGVV